MKNNAGFTIMELMTVIAIIGILSAIAIPNMIAWRANYQLNGSAREVMALINGARIDAIKNNATVTVTIVAANRRIRSQYTNRFTGVSPSPNDVFLRPQVNFVADDTFTFNGRGIPSKGATITVQRSATETRSVVIALTGNTRIQ